MENILKYTRHKPTVHTYFPETLRTVTFNIRVFRNVHKILTSFEQVLWCDKACFTRGGEKNYPNKHLYSFQNQNAIILRFQHFSIKVYCTFSIII